MMNSFLTSRKELVLSIHFSDSKQVIIFHTILRLLNDILLGEGRLTKSMGEGGVCLWAVN